MTTIEKLGSLGTSPIIDVPITQSWRQSCPHAEQISDLLNVKNGFYAFESALHVFPVGKQAGIMDIELWNSPDTWRHEYQGATDGMTFFAEDIFGFQFGVTDDGIILFNPEDAGTERLADDMEGWAEAILEDYNNLTGYSFAHLWQTIHGPLKENRRLIFKIPLILGGEGDISNVGEVSAIEGMQSRGYIYTQIRDLPDGATIRLHVTD